MKILDGRGDRRTNGERRGKRRRENQAYVNISVDFHLSKDEQLMYRGEVLHVLLICGAWRPKSGASNGVSAAPPASGGGG